MGMRPFRFAMQGFDADSAADWRDKVRRAEAEGYSAYHLADHYLGPGPAVDEANHPPQVLAAVPAMAMAAEATSTLKIGCRVFCTGYRPPAVLVKEAMTIDFLSEGRLELGLGAGWIEAEYHAIGVPYDPVGRRIDRLEETIQLAKAHRAGGQLNIAGTYAHAVGYEGLPRPKGPVPIMIGGGSPRVLRLAGREADIVSVNFNNRAGKIDPATLVATSMADGTHDKMRWIREGAGDRIGDVELETGIYYVTITDRQRETGEAMGNMLGLSTEDMLTFPHALVGSIDFMCEELERRRELYGFTYFSILDRGDGSTDGFAPVVARLAGK
ncbi:MAG: TIGR03621 family F420-dependent LLM class oxidoreductase [Alphaproteobacteria bacterium]|nr:TIGR03621 family F420-dependent LLM class oxidoreductase [Alphaproteobacteria bacterium]